MSFENSNNPEAWDIGNFQSEPFAEDPQYPSYDDNLALSDPVTTLDVANWTSPPLQAPTVPDPAETFQDSTGPKDFTPSLDPSGFTFDGFGIERPISGEASRLTGGAVQEFSSEISNFLSTSFAEHSQCLSYDDNPALSDTLATPGIARWSPPLLPAPTVPDPAEASHDPNYRNDFFPDFDIPGFSFAPVGFGIVSPTYGEASRSTQGVVQDLRSEDELFFLDNVDANQHSATRTEIEAYAGTDGDPLEQGAPSTNAAQAGMLGLSGLDHHVAATSAVDFDWDQPSTSIEAAECLQTANVMTQEISLVDGWSSIWNNTLPETGLDSAHSSAWVPLSANPELSWGATASPIPMGTGPAEQRPHSSSALLPSTQIAPRTPNYERHPLPQAPYRTLAPILSKESPSTIPSSVENRQILLSPSHGRHQAALVPHAHASATRSGKKRTRSPQGKNGLESYLGKIDLRKRLCFEGNKKQQLERRKRIKGDACLRCQRQNLKCSDTFPCEECEQLFFRNKHSNVMVRSVQWTCCIHSNISKLNPFPSAVTSLNYFGGPINRKDEHITGQSLDQYLQRVRPAAKTLMLVVEETTAKAANHQHVGLQTLCSALLDLCDPTRFKSSFHGLRSLLSRKPLYLPRLTDYEESNPSLAWIFAITTLFPMHLAREAKLTVSELRDFILEINAAFFAGTEKMLKHAKSSKNNSHRKIRLILNEHLITIYLLATFPTIQHKFHFCRHVRDIFEHQDIYEHQHPVTKGVKLLCDAATKDQEVWDHLQNYTLHWLEWLQEGFNAYDRTETKPFDLNTFCRMTETLKSSRVRSATLRGGPLDQDPEDLIDEVAFLGLEKYRDLQEKFSSLQLGRAGKHSRIMRYESRPHHIREEAIREATIIQRLYSHIA